MNDLHNRTIDLFWFSYIMVQLYLLISKITGTLDIWWFFVFLPTQILIILTGYFLYSLLFLERR